MFTQIAGIVLLAVMFIIATALPINMGALALVTGSANVRSNERRNIPER